LFTGRWRSAVLRRRPPGARQKCTSSDQWRAFIFAWSLRCGIRRYPPLSSLLLVAANLLCLRFLTMPTPEMAKS